MKLSIQNDVVKLAAGLIVAAMLAPAAYAQFPAGGSVRRIPQVKPISLQAATPAQQPSRQRNMALIGPGPIFAATTTNLFAQVAFGGGYTTIFSFMNTGTDATTGNLFLTDNNGQALNAAFTSPGKPGAVGSSFPLSLPSGGSQVVTAGPVTPATDPTSVGWARVESEGGSLGGVATFQFTVGNVLSTIVGVLSATATSVATIPVDDDHSAPRDTGYAVANPGSTPINIKIVLVHPDGTIHQTVLPPALNPLPPGGHVATFIWQDLNDQFLLFRGSMVLIEQSGKTFSVVALVLNKGLFTAIPVIPAKAPGIQ